MRGIYKHLRNSDVAIDVLYSIKKQDGLECKIHWLNIVNENKTLFIEKDKISIKNEHLMDWERYPKKSGL